MHINILPFFNDVANRTIAVSVTVCLKSLKKMKFGKWRYISLIKLMQQMDISAQIYSFLLRIVDLSLQMSSNFRYSQTSIKGPISSIYFLSVL